MDSLNFLQIVDEKEKELNDVVKKYLGDVVTAQGRSSYYYGHLLSSYFDVEKSKEAWYKENPEFISKVEKIREISKTKNPNAYTTKKQAFVPKSEVDKFDRESKSKSDWFNKFVKK